MTTEQSIPVPSKPVRSRRRLSLSLRALMLIVLVVSVGLGWISNQARVQRKAVATIRRTGGNVSVNWPWVSLPSSRILVKNPGPAFLRRWLGPEYFDTVTYVDYLNATQTPKLGGDEVLRAAYHFPMLEDLAIVHTDATDAGAEGLGRLTKLKSLDLRMNQMTARTVKDFGNLTELRKLELGSIPLRDEDMTFLRKLTKLETLLMFAKATSLTDSWLENIEDLTNLNHLEVTDIPTTTNGLRHLRKLTNLSILSLRDAKVDDLKVLKPLTNLAILDLHGSPIDDEDLIVLQNFPKLYHIGLLKTKITDHGLAHLRAVPNLTHLNLTGTAITDAGLLELGTFPKLWLIWIGDTKITDKARAAFILAHPTIRVR